MVNGEVIEFTPTIRIFSTGPLYCSRVRAPMGGIRALVEVSVSDPHTYNL
jgi:hypothetical protein